MYDKEDELNKSLRKVKLQLKQLQEDKELLQYMIMHQSNKKHRVQFKR